MVENETLFTQSAFYFFSILFMLLVVMAIISLIFPKLFTRLKLPNSRVKQFIILIIFSMISLALAHIFIPVGFP